MPNFTQPKNWQSSQYLNRLDIFFKLVSAHKADIANSKDNSLKIFLNVESYFKANNLINEEGIKSCLEINDLDSFISVIDTSTNAPRLTAELINLCCDIKPIRKISLLKKLQLVLPNSLRITDYLYHWMNHETFIRSSGSSWIKTHSIENLMRLKYKLLKERNISELHFSPFHGVSIGHFCAYINGICYQIQNKSLNSIDKIVIWTHSEHSIGFKLEKILDNIFPSVKVIDCNHENWYQMEKELQTAYNNDQFFDIRFPADPSYFTSETIKEIREKLMDFFIPSDYIKDSDDCALVHVRTSSFKPDSKRYHMPRNADVANYNQIGEYLFSKGLKTYLYPSGDNKKIDHMITFNTNNVVDQINQVIQILKSSYSVAAPSGISHLFYLGTDDIVFANHTDLLIHTNYISKNSLFCLKSIIIKDENVIPPSRNIFIDIILQDWTYIEFENYFMAVENTAEELRISLHDLFYLKESNIQWQFTLSNLCNELGITRILSTDRLLSRHTYMNLLQIGMRIKVL